MSRHSSAGFRPNGNTPFHAEGHVFDQALQAGERGGAARLFVDSTFCKAGCQWPFNGVENMARALQFERVETFVRLSNGHIVSGLLYLGANMLLTFDDAISGGKSIESPKWAEVEAAIRAMNGTDRTEVGVFSKDDEFLQVGGGGETYVCSVRADGRVHVLFDPHKVANETRWVVAGQGAQYPEGECFPVSTIVDIAKWFWEHRTPSPEHHWKSY